MALGSVLVDVPGGARGRIVDLSSGGVRFQLAADEPRVRAGATVTLDLRLDGAAFGWFRFHGVALRVSRDGEVAVAFTSVPAEFASAIRDELLSELASKITPRIVVVDPQPGRRALVAAAIRAAGYRVDEATTALEVISRLGDSRTHPSVVVVADTAPAEIADELRRYLRDAHATVKVLGALPGRPTE